MSDLITPTLLRSWLSLRGSIYLDPVYGTFFLRMDCVVPGKDDLPGTAVAVNVIRGKECFFRRMAVLDLNIKGTVGVSGGNEMTEALWQAIQAQAKMQEFSQGWSSCLHFLVQLDLN
jgi:hypothetical protein